MKPIVNVGSYDKNPGCNICGWRWHGLHGGARSCCPRCGTDWPDGFDNWQDGRWLTVLTGYKRPWWRWWGPRDVPVHKSVFALEVDSIENDEWRPYRPERK